jgi:hypothetical protein
MTLRISSLKYNTLNRLEMFFLSIVKNVPQPIAVKIGVYLNIIMYVAEYVINHTDH